MKDEITKAAAQMLDALQEGRCPCWVHNAGITNDIEALRKIALWHADWNNNVRIWAIKKALGCKIGDVDKQPRMAQV